MCERTIEFNQDMYTIFIDQEKAFDRVNRDQLWAVLEDYGVRGQLTDNVRAIYHVIPEQLMLSQNKGRPLQVVYCEICETGMCPITIAVHCVHG